MHTCTCTVHVCSMALCARTWAWKRAPLSPARGRYVAAVLHSQEQEQEHHQPPSLYKDEGVRRRWHATCLVTPLEKRATDVSGSIRERQSLRGPAPKQGSRVVGRKQLEQWHGKGGRASHGRACNDGALCWRRRGAVARGCSANQLELTRWTCSDSPWSTSSRTLASCVGSGSEGKGRWLWQQRLRRWWRRWRRRGRQCGRQ